NAQWARKRVQGFEFGRSWQKTSYSIAVVKDIVYSRYIGMPSQVGLPSQGGIAMIVVTTPTGNIGSQVLEKLARSDEEIYAVGRSPAKLSPQVRERVGGIGGAHGDSDEVDEAFGAAGTD